MVRSRLAFTAGALLAALLSLVPRAARAQQTSPQTEPQAAAPEADTARPPPPSALDTAPRPWLYTPDPSGPLPGQVLASLGAGYAQIDRGAARPFAGNVAQGGAVFGASGEVGVLRVLSIQAEGLLAGDGSSVNGGAVLGAVVHPFPARWPVTLAVGGGYLRELGGDQGAWGRVTFASDLGPVRLMAGVLGSHLFAPGRDGLDWLLSTGASYRLGSIVRLGVEYVVQDLEEAGDSDEVDGGVRHFLGPSVGLTLARRVQLTAGPAFGLSRGAPPFQGRMAAIYAF
ncbi:MAG: hypothetical protein U0359_21440 [Byssovorax sp.]